MEGPLWPYDLIPLSWGAESNLYLSTYMSMKVVIKHRYRKPYMRKELTDSLIKDRTLQEAKVLLAANRLGVRAPLPLYVDPENGLLVMEYVEGALLRDVIESLSDGEVSSIAKTLGEYVARLHDADIIHGDLTTSNVILSNGEVVLIDFGLSHYSPRPVDKASDLRVLERAIVSTHPARCYAFFKGFLEGYRVASSSWNEVFQEFLKLSTMGRYFKKRFLR